MAETITIKNISRITKDDTIETITFSQGVNTIIGQPNAGKSTWIRHLDFLLGRNKAIKDVFHDEELGLKYVEINGVFEIADEKITVTRRPFDSGLATKVILNDEVLDTDEFSKKILEKLRIPNTLKFPKGNPYTTPWIDLTFRILFRHIYRSENSWDDIADKQPNNEQYAAQHQIFGTSHIVYSHILDTSIINEKELARLEAQKAEYKNILSRIAQEMAPKDDNDPLSNASKIEIDARIAKLELELSEIAAKRERLINNELESREDSQLLKSYAEEKANLVKNKLDIEDSISDISTKIDRFTTLGSLLSDELNKLKRTKSSSKISDIKVTHCPACDQEVDKTIPTDNDTCFLCHQHITHSAPNNSYNRIEFELKQLEEEQKEINEIIQKLNRNISDLRYQEQAYNERLNYINRQLTPVNKTMFIIDSNISAIDIERGSIMEKIETYNRLKRNILRKEQYNKEIKILETKIETAQKKYTEETSLIDFETIADDLTEGMQYYVDNIARLNSDTWKHKGHITASINETRVSFYVNNKSWNSLGALDKDIFLLSYQFGLLTLTRNKKYNYPGLVIIDLPAQIAQASPDKYNYILQPFITYCKTNKDTKKLQVIIAGRSFKNDTDINIISIDPSSHKPSYE